MTQEDIIKLALEAGCIGPDGGDPNGLWEPKGHENVTELMMKFAALVAEHEREACARVCDKMFHDWTNQEFESEDEAYKNKPDAEDCKKAIRARGEK